jgi:type II secretory pathway pseudopilin PulG
MRAARRHVWIAAARPTILTTRNDSSENDSRGVRYWRMVAVLVVAVAAAITVSTIVIVIRNSQQAQFKSEFGRLAETILQSLNQDFSNFLFCGRSLAAALTVALQLAKQSHLELVMPPDSFDLLSNSAVVSTRSSYVSWNPLIRNDNERRIFETVVTKQEKAGLLDSKSFPPCHVCGSSEMEPSNANVQVVLPAVGSYRCSQLDAAGRTGVIPSDSCQIVSQKVQQQCACAPSPDHELDYEPVPAASRRNASQGFFRYDASDTINEPWRGGPYLPMWQDRVAHARAEPLLFNHFSQAKLAQAVSSMLFTGQWQISNFVNQQDATFYGQFKRSFVGPMSVLYLPVQSADRTEIVGAISMVVDWTTLHTNANTDLDIVVDGSCGGTESGVTSHTYGIAGPSLDWKGPGNLHDAIYKDLMVQSSFDDFELFGQQVGERTTTTNENVETCRYRFTVYATAQLEAKYVSSEPFVYGGAALAIFLVTSAVFLAYDYHVRQRPAQTMAKQTDSSLPRSVRGR